MIMYGRGEGICAIYDKILATRLSMSSDNIALCGTAGKYALLSAEDDPGGREQKVQQANIHTFICPKMSNCSPSVLITRNQSQGG